MEEEKEETEKTSIAAKVRLLYDWHKLQEKRAEVRKKQG
jgi:hypothetical protein